MRAHESLTWGPLSSDTGWFTLAGGQYLALATCVSWNGGSVVLYIIGPDNVTRLSAINALTANGGGALTGSAQGLGGRGGDGLVIIHSW